jgi:hypothetical protein
MVIEVSQGRGFVRSSKKKEFQWVWWFGKLEFFYFGLLALLARYYHCLVKWLAAHYHEPVVVTQHQLRHNYANDMTSRIK